MTFGFFFPIFPISLVQSIFLLPFLLGMGYIACSPILALVKKSLLLLGAGCGSFDSQSFRYLRFFVFFFFLFSWEGFVKFACFHSSPLLSFVSDRFMNSSRKIPVVLVFVLGLGRTAPDNQCNGRGLFCFKVPFDRR